MRILIIHQPFPMGNYKLSQALGTELNLKGHEVITVHQLNMSEINEKQSEEFINLIDELNPDAIYYEMLDAATFNVIKNVKCKNRILCATSNGILGYDGIVKGWGTYYDKLITNSRKLYDDVFTNICAEKFNYYFLAINDSELIYNPTYDKKCVFLGMGFNRLTDESYKTERELFFSGGNDSLSIYGQGWGNHSNWISILPSEDIGSLYKSAKSAVAIIGKGQRELGMINNRYSEIAFSKCPIITYPYDIDWFGAENYMNFVKSPADLHKTVSEIYRNPDKYHYKCNLFRDFIVNENNIFYEKLTRLLYV